MKNPLENKISSRKFKFPAEREIFRWKFQSSAGKFKNLLENKFFSGKSKSSARKMKHLLENLKILRILLISSGRFGFPAERTERLVVLPSKPQKRAIFTKAFGRRPAAEKILSRFDISQSDRIESAETGSECPL